MLMKIFPIMPCCVNRCDKESERRGSVEAELSDMRLLQEGLLLHTLPELHKLRRDLTQRLTELQRQHQQVTTPCITPAGHAGSPRPGVRGVAVEMQTAASSDLIQQLEHLRRAGDTLLHQKQCYNTQVSLLSSPALTFDPRAGSEVIQAEVEELWRTAGGLEEELTQLQDLNMVLEASSLQQTESFDLQLMHLQQKADVLCRDLDSELQFAAQQAEEHQALLEVNSRLETQIEDYRRLLDASSIQGLGGMEFGGPGGPSIIADQEEQLGFGGLYRSGSKLSSSPGSHRISSSGRFASTGSGDSTPVYSSANERRNTVGIAGRSGGGGTTNSQRAPSPGWLSSSPAGRRGMGPCLKTAVEVAATELAAEPI
ncbi:hypothetical protein NQZ68_028909 [Dissostichus eleginoides]|nr:hypothetical protein NQZ68_028909 [Dissostichus eleginoides]